MEKLGKGQSLAVLLAMLAVTCAVAYADSDIPPPRSARLGLAIASLDESWRETNAYRASGLMVVGVDPRGRAAKSGIVAGDVLVSVGSRTMREPSDLGHAERSLSPDKAVSVVLARDGGHMIKIFEIAPVGAVPVVVAAPAAASALPAVAPTSEPAPLPALAPTVAASDTTPPPPLVTPTFAVSDTAPPWVLVAAPAAATESALPLAVVATTSAATDTASRLAASGASAVELDQAASLKAASDASPSVTTTGTAGTLAASGGSASSPVSLAAPAAVLAVPVAAAVTQPDASPATTSATVDSGGTPPESVEPEAAVLGVVGKPLTSDLAIALGATGTEGILVLELEAASPADRSGVRAGDIIVKVGSQPVADMGEFQRAAAASATPIQLSTLRLGKAQVVDVTLDGPPPVPIAPPTQEQLLAELRDEVRSLRREVQSLRKKLGK